jgi:hypothetical protein
MTTAVAAAPAVRLASKSQSGFLVGPVYDGLFFIGSPLLALGLGLAISGTSITTRYFRLFSHEGTAATMFIGGFTMAHLVIVFFRSHGNRTIFSTHPYRFTVVPLLLLAAMTASLWVQCAVAVLATFWDVYHSSLQTFGLARIYDRRAGNDPTAGRRLDYLLNLLLYAGPIVAGVSLMKHVNEFKAFRAVGSVLLARLPERVESIHPWLTIGVLATGIPFLVYYVVRYAVMAREGYRVSPQKVMLLVSTAACSITCWTFDSFGQAFFVMNFFHALQYFALVWHIEKGTCPGFSGCALARRDARDFRAFVGLGAAYGFFAEVFADAGFLLGDARRFDHALAGRPIWLRGASRFGGKRRRGLRDRHASPSARWSGSATARPEPSRGRRERLRLALTVWFEDRREPVVLCEPGKPRSHTAPEGVAWWCRSAGTSRSSRPRPRGPPVPRSRRAGDASVSVEPIGSDEDRRGWRRSRRMGPSGRARGRKTGGGEQGGSPRGNRRDERERDIGRGRRRGRGCAAAGRRARRARSGLQAQRPGQPGRADPARLERGERARRRRRSFPERRRSSGGRSRPRGVFRGLSSCRGRKLHWCPPAAGEERAPAGRYLRQANVDLVLFRAIARRCASSTPSAPIGRESVIVGEFRRASAVAESAAPAVHASAATAAGGTPP